MKYIYNYYGGNSLHDLLSVTFYLSKQCNYRCSYCSQDNYEDKILDLKIFKTYIKSFFEQAKKHKKLLNITLMGGELLFLDLEYQLQLFNILNNISKNYNIIFEVNISTNFYRSEKWLINYFKQLEKIISFELVFTISVHEEYSNFKSLLLKIKNINKNIKLNKIKFSFYLLNKNLIEIEKYKDLFESNSFESNIIDISFNRIDHDYYYDFNYKIKCGSYIFSIFPNGKIKDSCSGNIFENHLFLNKYKFLERICPNKKCICPSIDLMVKKKLIK